jgi:hypothetical protein
MVFEYGFGATIGSVSWTTPGGAFDWSSPVTGSPGAAVNGNVAGRVTGVGGTIGSLTWNDGDTLWLRWTERNDVDSDHGLAIDDFSLSARGDVAVPEILSSWWSAALLLPMLLFSRRAMRANLGRD